MKYINILFVGMFWHAAAHSVTDPVVNSFTFATTGPYSFSVVNPSLHSGRYHPKLRIFDSKNANTFTVASITIDTKFGADASFQISDIGVVLQSGNNTINDLLTTQVKSNMLADLTALSKGTYHELTLSQVGGENFAPSAKIWADKDLQVVKLAFYSPSVNTVKGWQINPTTLANYLTKTLNAGNAQYFRLDLGQSSFNIHAHAIEVDLLLTLSPESFALSSIDVYYFDWEKKGNEIKETEKKRTITEKELKDNRILQPTNVNKDLFSAQQTSGGTTTTQDTSSQGGGTTATQQSSSGSSDTSSDNSGGLLF